ncbi:MAG: aldo/keto reductase [Hoeflea sp.]|uniref:aldo/keto reductase n=1 Tax=Hoeflea sp. TaxID=1940281 RepID=UPI001D31F223|nr:aldo/keto reductase [Hoeflea sp.]MBU4530128.1 aldo/keto reductase [Alphaproteobacteria bacterium]MBU4542587.1 aldo/keto reductase [Alphaproteobacteria bacterium]MBU4551268.1 aldo/keto reductase [Alphaproteobacteria bacterium]MBV1723091.1 aldo/keto reductase [Hoeflea sp.]MBV1760102.1 aldo/keto reductase [Hoeflea sp.]
MKMNPLGRTGMMVSEICLGTMTWGEQNTEAQAHEQMDYALTQGVNFFDAAEMYPTPPRAETQGRTEEIIGSWFRASGKRNDVILATKMVGDGIKWVRDGKGYTRSSVMDAVDGSLKRLGIDHIDLYQLHWPNRGSYHFRKHWAFDASTQDKAGTVGDIHETLEGLNDAVKAGKIRAVGLSNESAWGTMQFVRLAEAHGLPRVASIQNEYNLICRLFDTDLAEVAHHEDVGLLAFSPLAAGILTGKYQGDVTPEGSRRSLTPNLGGRWGPESEAATAAYLDVARKHGLDPAHMAIAFCLTRPFMTSAIIGATTMAQLETAIGSKEVKLSEAILEDIATARRAHPLPI